MRGWVGLVVLAALAAGCDRRKGVIAAPWDASVPVRDGAAGVAAAPPPPPSKPPQRPPCAVGATIGYPRSLPWSSQADGTFLCKGKTQVVGNNTISYYERGARRERVDAAYFVLVVTNASAASAALEELSSSFAHLARELLRVELSPQQRVTVAEGKTVTLESAGHLMRVTREDFSTGRGFEVRAELDVP